MRYLTVAVLTAFGSCLGCGGGEERQAPLTPASRVVPSVNDAASALATERCDREVRCNQVGANARYATREDCMDVMRQDSEEELADCHAGIDESDLGQCLTEIRTQDCNGPLDQLEQFVACRSDDLCLTR